MKPGTLPRAVFLDRDGTLIRNYHYGREPSRVCLLPGVVEGLRWLQGAGYRLAVVTNQAGVARGFLCESDVAAVNERLLALLADAGIAVENVYYCPHGPEGVVAGYVTHCQCRKPEPGLLLRASVEMRVSLSASWYIGDVLADAEAGNRAGCRTVLLDLGTEPLPSTAIQVPTFVARNLPHAVRLILAADGQSMQHVEPLPLEVLNRPRLVQGSLRPGDPSPVPDARWVTQAALESRL
ncbi:MAG: HAD-IIIA family hydrolase [Anaerolineae bacterium]